MADVFELQRTFEKIAKEDSLQEMRYRVFCGLRLALDNLDVIRYDVFDPLYMDIQNLETKIRERISDLESGVYAHNAHHSCKVSDPHDYGDVTTQP